MTHGTHVAGIAGAKTNNNEGVAGVDWHALLYSKKINHLNSSHIDPEKVPPAVIDAVDKGCFVLNNSWSGKADNFTHRRAFAYAYKMNSVSACAMGNNNHSYIPRYPAAYGQGIIAVGATKNDDAVSAFTNFGDHIDVVAPGGTRAVYPGTKEEIYSTVLMAVGRYDYMGGTSMATPFVTGVVSLLKGFKSKLNNDDVEQLIRISADNVPGMGGQEWTPEYGDGRLNVHKALNFLRNPWEFYHETAIGGDIVEATDKYKIAFYDIPDLSDGIYIVKRYKIRKYTSFPINFVGTYYVWGRGVATKGFSMANPNFGMGWCEAERYDPWLRLTTYVYYVWDILGNPIGWFPCKPQDVVFAYSVLGRREINAPSDLKSKVLSDSKVYLKWNDNSFNELGFRIEITGGQWPVWTTIKEVGKNVIETEIDGLPSKEVYRFRICAFAQEYTSGYSNEIEVTMIGSPSDFDIKAYLNRIELSWIDHSGVEDGFRIYKQVETGTPEYIVIDKPNQTGYTDYDVEIARRYTYKVQAFYKEDANYYYSSWSNPRSVRLGGIAKSGYFGMRGGNDVG